MKILIIIISFLLSGLHGYTQNKTDTALISRLYNEIRNYNQLESRYIGCHGHKSDFYKKVDSLEKLIAPDVFIGYFDDSSHILKYYSYILILIKRDELALEKLKSIIHDDCIIDFEFAGHNRGTMPFNEMLIIEYLSYLKSRYYYGGRGTFRARVYSYPAKDLKKWKSKRKELFELVAQNGLNRKRIEEYSGY